MPTRKTEEPAPRSAELAGRKSSKIHKELIETFQKIREGYEAQGERSDHIMDNWDAYNCILGQNQGYNGNAQLFVPLIRAAVNARKTRFVNQIFPSSGRYIDAASDDGSIPTAIVALLEHYVRSAKLRTEIMMALCRNGDIEGQYNVYVDWNETVRHVTSRVSRPLSVPNPGVGPEAGGDVEVPDEEVEDIEIDEEVVDSHPAVEVLHDTDILVRPSSADSIEDALSKGGDVTIIRRWTRDQIEQKLAAGELIESATRFILDSDGWSSEQLAKDASKENIDAAGIKTRGKFCLVYETWKILDVGDGERRLTCSYYGGYNLVLSCRRNPYWNDRCPLLSVPVDKVSGSFKGKAPVDCVLSTQYHANDIANQAADSATYSMLPIIMTDPAANPRTATMVLNLAAVWECNPQTTQFAQFPKLWQDGIALIQADMQMVFMMLGVNPAMLPQQTGKPGAKRNQAEVALEQSVDLLTTAEACSVLEEGILTPLMNRFGEYDSQFRDDEVTISAYGELGIAAKMERIPPRQFDHRYTLTWFGIEQAKNAAEKQQQIALLNVVRSFQPMIERAGYTFNPIPVLESAMGSAFGWRLARLVLRDARANLSVDGHVENDLLDQGFDMQVSPMDDDQRHLQVHGEALRSTGDPTGMLRIHMQKHLQSMQMKNAAMMQRAGMPQQPGGGAPGGPGGGGMPQPGASPAGPRLLKPPPGTIHADRMPAAGAVTAPRHF